jgi:MFS family permease
MKIESSVKAVAIASMLLTLSASIVCSLVPIYLINVLHASKQSVGFLEGFVESISLITRIFSGVLCDIKFSCKNMMMFGFSIACVAKFLMVGSFSMVQMFLAKSLDRIGNGMQAAPRDAFIGHISDPKIIGKSYGFAQSIRKWGSAFGASFVCIFMYFSSNSYYYAFMIGVIPSILGLICLYVYVPNLKPNFNKNNNLSDNNSSNNSSNNSNDSKTKFSIEDMKKNLSKLSKKFWIMISAVSIYNLAHYAESFFQFKGLDSGFSEAETTFLIVILCFTVFLSAYPLGKLSDKVGVKKLFILGLLLMIASNMTMYYGGTNRIYIYSSCILWGIHWAITQGLLLSTVVNLCPENLKGTAFGVFYITSGISSLICNTGAGYIWDKFGSDYVFISSALIAFVTILISNLIDFKAPRIVVEMNTVS